MMKIVRKVKQKCVGGVVEVDCCHRGPFLTQAFTHDGKRRQLVVTLFDDHMTIRYAKCRKRVALVKYEDALRGARAKLWKVGPRK